MNNINIGKKIKGFRQSKDLNIKVLAERAGVSSSLLSQIEKAGANPSINTIKNIADVLEVPLYLFFKEDEARDSFIVRARDRRVMGEEEGAFYELLTSDMSGSIEFMMLTLAKGSHSSEKRREHRGEEVAYILSGSVELHLEGDVFTLEKGDSAKIESYMKHKWINIDSKEAKIIFAINPPCF